MPPPLLNLAEPTNHRDIESIESVEAELLFKTHREATAKAIGKAMRNEPTIDWLLENQDKVQHYYHQLAVEGKLG